MKQTLAILVILVSLSLATGLADAAAYSSEGQVSTVSEGPQTLTVQAASLAGLWALSLSADLARLNGEDLLSFYPSGALSAPAARLHPGFSLGLRRHLSENFFVGAQLSSLPKSYQAGVGGQQDTWLFDGLLLGLNGGWLVYRAVSVAFYAEAQVGWLTLTNGSLDRVGSGATAGSLEGNALAEQFSLGALWFILPSVALEAQGGYRFARLPLSLTTSAGRQTSPSMPEFYVDFSGSFARLGLSFFWGVKNPWGEQDAPPAPQIPPPTEGRE